MRLQQIQNNYLNEDLDALVNTSRKSIFESIGQGDAYFTQWEKEIHPVLCEVESSQAKKKRQHHHFYFFVVVDIP